LKTGKVKPMLNHINSFLTGIDYQAIDADEWDKQEDEKNQLLAGLQKANEAKPTGKTEDPAQKEDPKTDDDKEDSKEDFAFKPHRELTIYEDKVNFTQIDNSLKELSTKYYILLTEAITNGIKNIATYIERKKIIPDKKMSLVNELVYPGTTKIESIFRKMLVESSVVGAKEAKQEIKQHNFILDQPENVTDVAEWIKVNAKFLAGTEAAEILKKVQPILMDSINKGLSVNETLGMIETALKAYDIDLGAPRIENIVRTNVNKAWNSSRLSEFKKVENEITGYQFSAILDSRTSDICAEMDDKKFRKSEAINYNPPLHFQCRSLLVPIFKDEEFNGFDELPATKKEGGGFLKLT